VSLLGGLRSGLLERVGNGGIALNIAIVKVRGQEDYATLQPRNSLLSFIGLFMPYSTEVAVRSVMSFSNERRAQHKPETSRQDKDVTLPYVLQE
jgi:hypothetical protein